MCHPGFGGVRTVQHGWPDDEYKHSFRTWTMRRSADSIVRERDVDENVHVRYAWHNRRYAFGQLSFRSRYHGSTTTVAAGFVHQQHHASNDVPFLRGQWKLATLCGCSQCGIE